MDLTSIFSLWGVGLGFGVSLGFLPFLIGVLINFGYSLFKR